MDECVALNMCRVFLAFIPLIILVSCNSNDETNGIVSQPPFDKLTDSIHRFPSSSDLYYKRGELLYANEQTVLAEKDIRKAWELQPREEYALSLTTILRQRSVDSALVFLESAVKKIPGSVALQIGMARGYQQKGKTDRALAICDEVLDRYPGQLDAMQIKSELLKDENKDEESIATLEKAYRLSPGDVDLVHQLAFAYAEAKNPKVLALSDSLIKIDAAQRHAEPYYFKGLYYENIGNSTEALKNFNEAIHHDFHFLDAYMDKGQTLFNQKKYDAAFKTFQLAATISPSYADAWYWMGKTDEATGKKQDAILNYERAYGLDKTIKEAKEGIDRLGGQ